MEEPKIECHVVPSSAAAGGDSELVVCVGLPVGRCLHVRGKLRVRKIVSGALECLGHVMDDSSPPRDVFSPRGYSLLHLKAVSPPPPTTSKQKKRKKNAVDSSLRRMGATVDPRTTCWMVLERLEAPWTRILDECQTFRLGDGRAFAPFARDPVVTGSPVPESVEKRLGVNIYDDGAAAVARSRIYRQNDGWEAVVARARLAERPILVAGGKGVGKSTFVRFLVNRLLGQQTSSGPVLVVDLDPGQAEFTPPGCVTAVKVAQPLLGPNFCHLNLKPEVCFNLGEVSMANVPTRYARAVSLLLSGCRASDELSRLPWIINTMGFNHGLGLRLIGHVVKECRPSTVVEIRSRFARKNYGIDLGSFSTAAEPFDVLRFEAMPESVEAKDMGAKDFWGIPEPSKLRDLVVLSYLGRIRTKGPLAAAPPYRVSWQSVSVQNLQATTSVRPGDLAKVLNMSFVSLGVLRDPRTCGSQSGNLPRLVHPEAEVEAKGFGFVRGVDVQNQLFYVVTPLQASEVSSVDCISVGTVTLPEGIIANQPSRGKSVRVPYRQRARPSSSPLDAPWQRYSKPRNFSSVGRASQGSPRA